MAISSERSTLKVLGKRALQSVRLDLVWSQNCEKGATVAPDAGEQSRVGRALSKGETG
jgi:hypothetical protein